jgi:hypothetical protein
MPNLPKKPGDAVLSRDGTVKVDGNKVGYWVYEAPDIMPPMYHFSFEKGGDIVFSQMWKHQFKEDLPRFLEGKPPVDRSIKAFEITPDMLVWPEKKKP